MHGNAGFAPPAPRVDGFMARVASAVEWPRVGAVALVTVLLSLGALVSPALLDFFSPAEIALAWLEHLLELALIATALLAAFTVLDAALPHGMPLRLGVLCALLLAVSALLAVLLHAYYADGLAHLPPPLRMFADSLRWGLPAVFLALVADVHQRALQIDSAAHAAELARAQLHQGEREQQLALLQAQIEPHFLFNVLGSVRRLYRTHPLAGAEAVESLMHYLRRALPQLRSPRASLAEEAALVRAYLDLFRLRMGPQLDFAIEVDDGLDQAEFPPTLLVTLVENAIKHGLEPAGGGRVEVRARSAGNMLEVAVRDDGAGFGAAASSGTGVGLVNVRRQLAARYPGRSRLTLEERAPHGACATIVIPLRRADAVEPRGTPPPAPAYTPPPARAAAAEDMPVAQAARRNAARGFLHWLGTHRGAVMVAALLAFAAPLTFFTGAVSVMRAPRAAEVVQLGAWWTVYGVVLWAMLLATGYACLRLPRRANAATRIACWLLAAGASAACANLLAAGRATILLERGIVYNAWTMHLYAFMFSLIMALLYFAHLRRRREQETAAERLAAAQAAQRDAQRRLVEWRLQEVQARIDPQVLFDQLDTVRRLYREDASRAELFLDQLIDFLRAALPRLRRPSSSLLREVELARAYSRLKALARDARPEVTVEVAPDVMHARFPPGVLLPLLDGAAGRGGRPSRLIATRRDNRCHLLLRLTDAPAAAAVDRVAALLSQLFGALGRLEVRGRPGAIEVLVEVPYELA